MSPLIYIGLFIMLVTIVSEMVFLVNHVYVRLIKRQPSEIQKKIFITFGIMMCGFIIFLLGTQKVFSSKEVASFEIVNTNNEEQVVDVISPDDTDNEESLVSSEQSWYQQIMSQENKDNIDRILNDTGQFVDNIITTISDNISQLMN